MEAPWPAVRRNCRRLRDAECAAGADCWMVFMVNLPEVDDVSLGLGALEKPFSGEWNAFEMALIRAVIREWGAAGRSNPRTQRLSFPPTAPQWPVMLA